VAGKARHRLKGRAMRHNRIRKAVSGTSVKPRLAVFRSGRHIYASLVDDEAGVTLAAQSTLSKLYAERSGGKLNPTQASKLVGKLIAESAKEKGIEQVAFDRGGYLYHGRVKALAEGSREGGLRF
jgi:large subunit ribosomal protein L18